MREKWYRLQPFRRESRYKEISRGGRRLLGVLREILAAITVFLAILAAGHFVSVGMANPFSRILPSILFQSSPPLRLSLPFATFPRTRLFGFFWLLIDLWLFAPGLSPLESSRLYSVNARSIVQIVETPRPK